MPSSDGLFNTDQFQSLMQNGGTLTINIPSASRSTPCRSWALQWPWFVYRLKERAKIAILASAHQELAVDMKVMQQENDALAEENYDLAEQNDALALRLQFLIRAAGRSDLRTSESQWEKDVSVQTERTEYVHPPSDVHQVSHLSRWLELLDPSITLVDHGVGSADFPLLYLVYESGIQPRRRILKIDCANICVPREAEVESSLNVCKVTIPPVADIGQVAFQKEFSFKSPNFNFELVQEEMQIDDGERIMTLVFDIVPIVKLIARFSNSCRSITIDEAAVSPVSSSWAKIGDADDTDHDEMSSNNSAPDSNSGGDGHDDSELRSNSQVVSSAKKKQRGHRQRRRRNAALKNIPRTPSSTRTLQS